MAICCVILRGCGGSSVSNLGSCAGGDTGACGTAMLKMVTSCLRDVV